LAIEDCLILGGLSYSPNIRLVPKAEVGERLILGVLSRSANVCF